MHCSVRILDTSAICHTPSVTLTSPRNLSVCCGALCRNECFWILLEKIVRKKMLLDLKGFNNIDSYKELAFWEIDWIG